MPEDSGFPPEPTQQAARVTLETTRAAAAAVSEITSLNEQIRRVADQFAQTRFGLERVEDEECDCLSCRMERKLPERGQRAYDLLWGHLDESQRGEYKTLGSFTVQGKQGTYRLDVVPPASVHVLDGKYRGSKLCIQLHPAFHPCDAALARKLMIETAEDEFLRTACGLMLNGVRVITGQPVLYLDGVRVHAVNVEFRRDEVDELWRSLDE